MLCNACFGVIASAHAETSDFGVGAVNEPGAIVRFYRRRQIAGDHAASAIGYSLCAKAAAGGYAVDPPSGDPASVPAVRPEQAISRPVDITEECHLTILAKLSAAIGHAIGLSGVGAVGGWWGHLGPVRVNSNCAVAGNMRRHNMPVLGSVKDQADKRVGRHGVQPIDRRAAAEVSLAEEWRRIG